MPKDRDATGHVSGAATEAPASGLRVLVVEHQPLQRSLLAEMVEAFGARAVCKVADGREALQVLREQPFEIIIVDFAMPAMDGLSFICCLGENKLLASLIITSRLDRSVLATVEKISAVYGMRLLGTIEKPARPQQLAKLISLHRVPEEFSLEDV